MLNNNDIFVLMNKLHQIYKQLNENVIDVPNLSEITITKEEIQFLMHDCNLNMEINKPLDLSMLQHAKDMENNFNSDTTLTAQSMVNEKVINNMLPEGVSKQDSNVNQLSSPQPQSFRTISDVNEILTFGKHSGQNIKDILIQDPQYIIWIHDNVIRNLRFNQTIINVALNNKANKPYQKPTYSQPTPITQDYSSNQISDDDLPF